MKQCPNCKTTYTDDALRFCLADGASLISVPDAAETVRMSRGDKPVQINVPPDSAPTVFAPKLPLAQHQPAKKGLGLIIAGVLGVLLLLGVAGLAAAFFLLRQTDDKNPVSLASPTPTNKLTASPTVAPNDETARLKEEMANLQKQIQEQKNKPKTNSNELFSPTLQPKQTGNTTARANSPRDGFLALRSEPNSETGSRIAKIPHGATIIVLGCPKASNVGKMAGRWCQVVYNGQSGWAFDAFMIF